MARSNRDTRGPFSSRGGGRRPAPALKKAVLPLRLEQLEDRRLLATAVTDAATASVFTDKPDYAPGETALINATGFQAGETVRLQVTRTDGIQDYPNGNQPWEV